MDTTEVKGTWKSRLGQVQAVQPQLLGKPGPNGSKKGEMRKSIFESPKGAGRGQQHCHFSSCNAVRIHDTATRAVKMLWNSRISNSVTLFMFLSSDDVPTVTKKVITFRTNWTSF